MNLRTPLVILFFISLDCRGQELSILKKELQAAKHDTTRLRILNMLVETSGDAEWPAFNELMQKIAGNDLNSSGDPKLRGIYSRFLGLALNNKGYLFELQGRMNDAIECYARCLPLLERAGDRQGEATVVNNIGMIQLRKGNNASALMYLKISMKLMREIHDSEGIGRAYNNIGLVYDEMGDLLKAVEYYHMSLQIREKMNDKRDVSGSLMNIGTLYMNYNDYDRAEEYFLRSLKLLENSDDIENLQVNYNNLGGIYLFKGKDSIAMTYFSKALQICEKLGYYPEKASPLNNMGHIYLKHGEYEKAEKVFREVLDIRKKTNEPDGIASACNNIADVLMKQGRMREALQTGREAYAIALRIKRPENIRNTTLVLKNIYERLHQPDSALKMFKVHIRMRDSISNAGLHRATMKRQLQYDYNKKAQADSLRAAGEKKLMVTQLAGKKQERYLLFAGLAITALFGIFMLIKFRETRKQKNIIGNQKNLVEKQKLQVEIKQKEVLDSIHYAKRIQTSMLPSEKYLSKIFRR